VGGTCSSKGYLCCVFIDTLSRPVQDCVGSSGWSGGGEVVVDNLSYSGICLEELRETTKNLIRDD
jgi:hypothetical protein